MGNLTSSTNDEEQSDKLKPKPLSQILDYIATYYILTMDFKSLRKLYDKEYCNKLVILTSDIIQRYFTDMEITYLAKRVSDGVDELEKDKVVFFDRDDLNKFDVQSSVKKKRICLEIAKFYVKIAHVFAAVVTTINPIYVYKDTAGNKVRANLYEKGKIPVNTPREIYKLNICENRINSLKNKNTLDHDENGDISVGPNVCSSNIGDNGKDKNLNDEPGIPELSELYNDDNYNFETGIFTGMSEKTKKTYMEDLKIFYNVFTGKPELPANVTKFSDIKLREYHKMDVCKGDDPKFKKKVKGPLNNELFKDYAFNLKKMIVSANKNQQILLKIINELFVYTTDPQSKKKQIRVSPSLKGDRLQEIVVESRALIIKLYLTCEVDYVNGLNLYEAIVDKKMFETTQNQEASFKRMKENLVNYENVPESAEIQELENMAKNKIAEKKEELENQLTDIKKDEQIVEENPALVLEPNEATVDTMTDEVDAKVEVDTKVEVEPVIEK